MRCMFRCGCLRPKPSRAFGLFIPRISFGRDYLTGIVAILGTTISPYLCFWQSSQEVEDTKTMPKRKPLKGLGSSPEPGINAHFWQLKHHLNDNPDCHLEISYDEELAHLIYAGFHFTPKHASWLNQIEIWFSILARKLLRRAPSPSRSSGP